MYCYKYNLKNILIFHKDLNADYIIIFPPGYPSLSCEASKAEKDNDSSLRDASTWPEVGNPPILQAASLLLASWPGEGSPTPKWLFQGTSGQTRSVKRSTAQVF